MAGDALARLLQMKDFPLVHRISGPLRRGAGDGCDERCLGARVFRRCSLRQIDLEAECADLQHIAIGKHFVVNRLAVDMSAAAAGAIADAPAVGDFHNDTMDGRDFRRNQANIAAGRTTDDNEIALEGAKFARSIAVGDDQCRLAGIDLFVACFAHVRIPDDRGAECRRSRRRRTIANIAQNLV